MAGQTEASASITVQGRCHCGAISYVARGDIAHHALCHCADCRRWSGAPMVGWIALPSDQVEISGEPAMYRSSEHGRREFCSGCGTGLFYRNEAVLPGLIDIQSGTLDAPAAHAPAAHIMTAERLGWLDGMEALPKFRTYPGLD